MNNESKNDLNNQMSSEDMFSSWAKQLSNGDEEVVNTIPKVENNTNPFEDITFNNPPVDDIPPLEPDIPIFNNSSTFDNSSPFDSSPAFDNNIPTFNNDIPTFDTKVEQPIEKKEEVQKNIPQVPIMQSKVVNPLASDISVDPDNGNNKMALLSFLFILIILAGGGYFVYNTFFTSDEVLKPEKDVLKEEVQQEETLSPVEPVQNDQTQSVVDTPVEQPSRYKEELNRLCSLATTGEYYNEMTGNINDIDYLIENAKYCTDHICLYTENNHVYTMNCNTRLEIKYTIEEMKVSARVGYACLEYNKTGTYSNPDTGIKCSNGHCGTTYNGRSVNQDCRKFEGIG